MICNVVNVIILVLYDGNGLGNVGVRPYYYYTTTILNEDKKELCLSRLRVFLPSSQHNMILLLTSYHIGHYTVYNECSVYSGLLIHS